MSAVVELLNKLVDLFWEIKKQLAILFMKQSAAKVDSATEQAKVAVTPEEKSAALDAVIKVGREL
jgi:hypothetical protein